MATESMEYSGIKAPVFPRLRPVNNITPFTYQDGSTYLDILNKLEKYIRDSLVPDVDGALGEFVKRLNQYISDLESGFQVDRDALQAIYDTFTTLITEKVDFINNKTGATDIQRFTLTANKQITVDPLWPSNQPVEFAVKQDGTGGRTLTYAANITGSVEVNPAPNSLTRFILVPDGSGKWFTIQSTNTLAEFDRRAVDSVTPTLDGFKTDLAKGLSDISTSVDATLTAAKKDISRVETVAEDNGYVFANFLGNGTGYESLSMFYSPDGKTLFGGENNPVYTPADGYGLRDPSIIYWNDRFYVTYTTRDGQNKDIAIASSATGHAGSWSLVTKVNVSAAPGLEKAWAPEFVIDGSSVYIFFSRLTSNIGSMFYVKATNTALSSWSAPVKSSWTDEPGHHIDGVPVKSAEDGKWYLFYTTGTDINRAVATSLTTPWTTDKVGNWAGWGTGIEGPTMVRDNGKYRIYFDRFIAGTGLHYSESSSLNGPWSTPVRVVGTPYLLKSSEGFRHGSVVKLTDPVARNKVLAAQMLPRVKGNHSEFQNAPGIPINKDTKTVIQWVVPDENEMVNSSLVTFTEGGSFRLNEYCIYSISVTATAKNVTGVNRSFIQMTDSTGNTVHLRSSGGAEDVFSLNIANFKPRAAGEVVKFFLYLNWTGAESDGGVPVRVRISRVAEA